jgi:hypothetical protein
MIPALTLLALQDADAGATDIIGDVDPNRRSSPT